MKLYVYETIPQTPDAKPRYFEIKQSMNTKPLTTHPQTGKPIRRVVLGGFGVLSSSKTVSESSAGSSGCGPSCGCH
ncbi:MAG TPA: zinc ribbon domain-containing protein [Verrucomicrobiae bacterium]|nr:zinc ribbon domain-containing protein [Verrucomicrobiae bacterium]